MTTSGAAGKPRGSGVQGNEIELSVVVASVEAERTAPASIEALLESCERLGAPWEILLVDGSTDRTAEVVRDRFPQVLVHRLPFGSLVPALWGRGLALSRGRHVAFTTGHCVVGSGWCEALLDAMNDAAVGGAGGPLRIRAGTGPLDWAVYLLRYSAFLPDRSRETPGSEGYGTHGRTRTHEIAGDNALYRREDLRRHGDLFEDGFWEVPFHRELRREGRALVRVTEATAGFGPSWPFRTILAHRLAHGRQFGAWRVSVAGESRIRVMAAAPAVPLVLVLRTARRILGRHELAARFLASLPWFGALAGAWALGEALGAWDGKLPKTSAR